MAEYINREAAIRALLNDAPEQVSYSREDAANCIRYMDAADVAPVVHGRWIYIGKYGEYECSVCHGIDTDCSDYYSSHVVTEQDYCPNCGARMDGGKNDAVD